MKTVKNLSKILTVPLITIALLSGCSDSPINANEEQNDTNKEQPNEFGATAMLQNEANNVILQTYIDLDTEAGKLVTAVKDLKQDKSPANLEAAQKQWQETRKPWENSESFLFGPVSSKGIDPAIDSWPLNKTDLDNVLSSSDKLNKGYVDNLENTLKGFHTIEYLLFGDGSNKAPADFTSREFDYLIAAAKSLKSETAKLVKAWRPSGGNYVGTLANAGSTNSKYTSKKEAVEELVNFMEVIANEVSSGKIGGPLSSGNTDNVESQFSFNSKIDFKNNLRSIQHIYTGDYEGSSGKGVTDFVSKLDSDLDSRFKNEIDAAIKAIDDIPGHFRDAISKNSSDVANAQNKVRKVLSTVQEDIKPLLSEF